MRRISISTARTIVLTLVMAFCCYAQTAPQTLNIWPGTAPGSEKWTQKEGVETNTPIGAVVSNVVTPTLTVYLPEKTKATGTGLIIAPGGAFVRLAMDLEGHDVARWLQNKGIAAFVLKYRLMEKRQEGIPADLNMDKAGKYGIADGIQALKVVRQHAADKLGAMTTGEIADYLANWEPQPSHLFGPTVLGSGGRQAHHPLQA